MALVSPMAHERVSVKVEGIVIEKKKVLWIFGTRPATLWYVARTDPYLVGWRRFASD